MLFVGLVSQQEKQASSKRGADGLRDQVCVALFKGLVLCVSALPLGAVGAQESEASALPEEPPGDVELQEDPSPSEEADASPQPPMGDPHVTARKIEVPSLAGEPVPAMRDHDARFPPPEDPDRVATITYDDILQITVGEYFRFRISMLFQARYTLNHRSDPPIDLITLLPEEPLTLGFTVPRARLRFGFDVTRHLTAFLRIGSLAGGAIEVERAFGDVKWGNFLIRAGQFIIAPFAEDNMPPAALAYVDYTPVANAFSAGASQGVMFLYSNGRYAVELDFTDGFRTAWSEVQDAIEADYAFTTRAEFAAGPATLADFSTLIARRGVPRGIRAGVAGHFQSGGRTRGTDSIDMAMGTADVYFMGSGYVVQAYALVNWMDDGIDPALAGGFAAISSWSVAPMTEVHGGWSAVIPFWDGRPLGPPVPPGGLTPFHTLTVGVSHFLIPNHWNARLALDFNYYFNATASSLVQPQPTNGISRTVSGDQFSMILQLALGF